MRLSAFLLSASTMMILLTASLSAQGFQAGGPLVVRDGAGTLVGQYVPDHQVSVMINGAPHIMWVFRATLGSGSVYFDQPGCAGNAFINSGDDPIANRATRGPGGVLFTADASGGTQALTIASVFDPGGCRNVNNIPDTGVPATASTINVDMLFQPPFSLSEGLVNTPPVKKK